MIITKKQLYNNSRWKKLRIEVIKEKGKCTRCGSRKRLELHHVEPIEWVDGQTEVDSIWDLIEVDTQLLCHNCHMDMEKGEEGRNIAEAFVDLW